MSLALLLAGQAVSPAPSPPLATDFDLAEYRSGDPCSRDAPGSEVRASHVRVSEIVVCGRRPPGAYPLEKWERVFARKPLVAETSIGGGSVARAYVESVAMPRGEVSKRFLVGIRVPF